MDPKLKARITKALRREFLICKNRKDALVKADRGLGYYECAKCTKRYVKKMVEVDHVNPVVELTGFKDWNTFIDRLFFGELQVLCEACHQLKTNQENEVRRMKHPRAITDLFKDISELKKYAKKAKNKQKTKKKF